MLKLITTAQAYASNDKGATAIEYGLIAAGVAVAIMAVVFTMGGELDTMFGEVETKLKAR